MSFFGRKKIVGLFSLLVLTWMLATAPPSLYSETYTFDGDFDQGTLVNVNHDSPNNDQLQINQVTESFPFINVAASARGTMVRINTVTGTIVGEYRTAPEGRGLDPSRTTVDLSGNVWTTNRAEVGLINEIPNGSVVKIGLIVGGTRVDSDGETPNPNGDYLAPPFGYNTCEDRDSDGLIKTSRGLADIRPWPDVTDGGGGILDARVDDADDECILVYQRLPDAEAARHVSVDASNDVWVGGYPFNQRSFHKLDNTTGQILDSFNARDYGCGGYGGLIDGAGILWSASIIQNKLLRYDPVNKIGSCYPVYGSYGLGLDTGGFIWNSMYYSNSIVKVSAAGVIQTGFPKTTGGALYDRGVAVTSVDNNVWVANSGGNNVSRLNNNGDVVTTITVGITPTGVAVDAAGKVWVTNQNSDNVMRIDPATNLVDLTVDLGPGAGPYNYSDMTGAVLFQAVKQGTWNVVYDSEMLGADGCVISWNEEAEGNEPTGTSITVEARAADVEANLSSETFVSVTNGADAGVAGQFVEIKATLANTNPGFDTPVLSDLTIICNQPPVADPNGPYLGPLEVCFDGTGSSDPDGDPLTYYWAFGDSQSGTGATPCHTYAEPGIYNVCLIVNDGLVDSEEECTFAVVYDPSAGFVTGGGWIDSPAGAYEPDPELTGKANFGFVSKYKNGADTPTGNTEFLFHAADLNFHSDNYEWLLVLGGGTRAKFKGEGTINGEPSENDGLYKFMVNVQDSDPDTFWIRIWSEDNMAVETVVYDNGTDQVIDGGSIVIHTNK